MLFTFCFSPALAYHEIADLSRLVPGLNVMTTFAHDYGDMLYKVSYEGEEYSPSEATAKVLPKLNWSSRSDKVELGTAWVKVFALHGSQVLEAGDRRLASEEEAPRAEILPDGTFRYTAWVVVMSGREPGTFVYKKQVEITPDAIMKVVDLQSPTRGRPR